MRYLLSASEDFMFVVSAIRHNASMNDLFHFVDRGSWVLASGLWIVGRVSCGSSGNPAFY